MKGDHRREVNGRRWGGFYSWMQFLGFPHFVVLSKVCLWRFDGGLWHWARETAAPRGGTLAALCLGVCSGWGLGILVNGRR